MQRISRWALIWSSWALLGVACTDDEPSGEQGDAGNQHEDAGQNGDADPGEDAGGEPSDADSSDAGPSEDGSLLDGSADAEADAEVEADSGLPDQDQDGVPDSLDQCPSFDDSACSHGDCSGGSCVCNSGWSGTQCDSCAEGYYGASCTACSACAHGSCDDGLTGSGACQCATGFAGASCDGCAAGYFGSDCLACDCGHGTCADGLTGNGVCTSCDEGFFGASCAQACASCGAHGSCNDGPTGNGQCSCAGGYGGTLCDVDLTGTGADGDVTIAGDVDLGTANTGSRSCADGGDMVSYSVNALQDATTTTATLSTTPSAGCLGVGDEVLLINLQGTPTAHANVGRFELLRVQSVSADAVTFTTRKIGFYGEGASDDLGLGTTPTAQRVLLQRVPQYANLTVPAGTSLTAKGWDGERGGVFYMRVDQTLTVDGTISMSGLGYRGGVATSVVNTTGTQGETQSGLGGIAQEVNGAGGGGGRGDETGCETFGVSGGGGGHRVAGSAGSTTCSGAGGGTYGDATLARAALGSGGGSGGSDNVLSDNPPGGEGGHGGGFLAMSVNTLAGAGHIEANGADGQGDDELGCVDGASITSCWDFSGPGGGGAGGSLLLYRATNSFTGTLAAEGGTGGDGVDIAAGDGGNGGAGYLVTAP